MLDTATDGLAYVILVLSDRVLVDRLANDRASRAKVTDADLALIIDEEIRGLDVPVHEVFRVEELGGAQHVEHNCSHVRLLKLYISRMVEDSPQIATNKIHDENDPRDGLVVGGFGYDQVVYLCGVDVVRLLGQLLEDLDLGHCLLQLNNIIRD